MADLPSQLNVTVVDSLSQVTGLLADLRELDMDPLQLFVEFKGINVGRHGSLSLISIYVLSEEKIYLINIHILGMRAFYTQDSTGTTLKSILECPILPKAAFDIRNASDVLFSQYNITLAGFHDIQLMELAARNDSKQFLRGLATCVRNDSPLSEEDKSQWRLNNEVGKVIFCPEKGARPIVVNKALTESPPSARIINYCAHSIAILPKLYDTYNRKLSQNEGFWQPQLRRAIGDRVDLTKDPEFNVHDRRNAYGPWDDEMIYKEMEDWDLANSLRPPRIRGSRTISEGSTAAPIVL
ncbi:hypothetical protein FQN49_000313 [Arthroderma sp. PD_2]|nr:hypothetical protein FQN49_000313 [Arthroderma sp. PD_2]